MKEVIRIQEKTVDVLSIHNQDYIGFEGKPGKRGFIARVDGNLFAPVSLDNGTSWGAYYLSKCEACKKLLDLVTLTFRIFIFDCEEDLKIWLFK